MIPQAEPPAKPILPPRPNPGPEPWPDSPISPELWAVVAGMVLVGLTLILLWIRARQRARKKAAVAVVEVEPSRASADPRVRHAEVVRSALSGRFGPSWSAKTTEEVEASLRGLPEFDETIRRGLVRLLREADRVKFDERADLQGDEPLDWVEPVLAAVAAGANSTSKAR